MYFNIKLHIPLVDTSAGVSLNISSTTFHKLLILTTTFANTTGKLVIYNFTTFISLKFY